MRQRGTRVYAVGMDDIIAVEVRLADGTPRFFVTWGRIQDAVDTEPVCAIVMLHARSFSLGGDPVSARACFSLREAADSDFAPYFYECLMNFSRSRLPSGAEHEPWRQQRAEAMDSGKEISYCGRPSQPT
jgi:hypothetical protein